MATISSKGAGGGMISSLLTRGGDYHSADRVGILLGLRRGRGVGMLLHESMVVVGGSYPTIVLTTDH